MTSLNFTFFWILEQCALYVVGNCANQMLDNLQIHITWTMLVYGSQLNKKNKFFNNFTIFQHHVEKLKINILFTLASVTKIMFCNKMVWVFLHSFLMRIYPQINFHHRISIIKYHFFPSQFLRRIPKYSVFAFVKCLQFHIRVLMVSA